MATGLFLALMMVLPVTTASQGKAYGQKFPPPFLKGTRIGLFAGDYSVPADQPYFVIHGWVTPNWKDYSGQEKKSLLLDYQFVLEIDGVEVKSKKWIHHYNTYETPQVTLIDVMVVDFYVEFKAYEFEAGSHSFRGIWYGPGMTIEEERTITVQFS